jgi:hypothetical protein
MRAFLLALALALFGVDSAVACSVPWVSVGHKGTMTVRSGQPCDITFRSFGPIHAVRILKNAAHGTVAVGSANKVTYQSRVGYTGSDSFNYVYEGKTTSNGPMRIPVHIAVTVTQ